MYNPYDTLLDKIAYISGLIILFAGVTGIFVITHYNIDINDYIMPCTLNHLTGLYCPGCGGTRALRYLLCGRILTSLYYNPIVAYVFFPWIWFLVTQTILRFRNKRGLHNPGVISLRMIHPMTVRPRYIYTGIIILIAQCIIKNMLFLFWAVKPI
ncbi:MAG: DUF2752 domain-containing protein [Lachnospiraceae bacterium]|nr:DUF2752 domain-containing protein [Lachnospiraceae bacterium]